MIFIEEKEHDLFVRSENDIYVDCFVHLHQLILGDKIEVPYLGGKLKVTIPKGTSSGHLLRIQGKGIPQINGYKNGNQYIRLNVITNSDLNNKQYAILNEFKKEFGSNITFKRFNVNS